MHAPGTGEMHDHFAGVLISNLEADDAAFLTRIAIVDHLHADLCRALTGASDAAERLARPARETPIFVATEGSDWLRMHALARDMLHERLDRLPVSEHAKLHASASTWLAEQGMLEDAARHALAAGERETAYDLAERCLYVMLAARSYEGDMHRIKSVSVETDPPFSIAQGRKALA